MRVISYNLRKHKASGELMSLARNFGIDVLCLQECDSSDLPDTLGPLHLADYTKGNRLGLAIYYRAGPVHGLGYPDLCPEEVRARPRDGASP